MKKRKCVIIGLCVLLLVLSLIKFYPFLKTRLYMKDRITGTVNITVDSKNYSPENFTYYLLGYESDVSNLNIVDNSFSIKGGEYGAYSINFSLNNKDLYQITGDEKFKELPDETNVSFVYYSTNNWNISELNLYAKLTQENGTWKMSLKSIYTEQQEKLKKYVPITHEVSYNYFDEYEHLICSFGI